MQRKIIALAVAGLATCATSAQAYDFSMNGTDLSIYGIMDGSLYAMKSPTAAANGNTMSYGFASNNMQTSRLGFKVATDVGDGLKVTANLEQEISLATGGTGDGSTNAPLTTGEAGSGGQFNRAANVGLAGSWGEVKLGRQIAPSFLAAYQLDAMGSQTGGYANAWIYAQLLNSLLLTGHGNISANTTNLNYNGGAVAPNLFVSGLGYNSPVMNGLQVKLFQTFGSNHDPVSGNQNQSFVDSAITDLSVNYENGPLVVRFADQDVRAANGGYVGSTGSYEGSLVGNLQLGGQLKFGDTKVTLDYGKVTYNADYKAFMGSIAPDNVSIVSLGATQQMGAMKLGVSYTQTKDTDNTANGANEIAFLADYTLSKLVDVYAQVTSTDNKGGAQFAGVYGAVVPTTTGGGNVNAVLSGVRFKF